MTTTYPFSRAKAIGWAYGEILTSAQMNIVDDNASQAADGAFWTHLGVGLTWISQDTVTDSGYSPLWRPGRTSNVDSRWFTFGVNGGNPLAAASGGFGAWTTGWTIDAGDGLTPAANGGSASTPDGVTAIVGGTPGIASTKKIRTSATSGASFVARNTVASGTEGVTCAIWHDDASKFVIGLSNSATTNIETSADGVTWTQITGLPNSNARGAMGTNGAVIVCLSSASVNKCLRSTDGATWTESTMPETAVWNRVIWDSYNELFIASRTSSVNVAYSADGITWALSTTTVYTPGSLMCAIGRVIVSGSSNVGICGAYDSDTTTATFGSVLRLTGTARGCAAAPGQFILTDANGVHFRSLRFGDID